VLHVGFSWPRTENSDRGLWILLRNSKFYKTGKPLEYISDFLISKQDLASRRLLTSHMQISLWVQWRTESVNGNMLLCQNSYTHQMGWKWVSLGEIRATVSTRESVGFREIVIDYRKWNRRRLTQGRTSSLWPQHVGYYNIPLVINYTALFPIKWPDITVIRHDFLNWQCVVTFPSIADLKIIPSWCGWRQIWLLYRLDFQILV
jgi:hypothetical protein